MNVLQTFRNISLNTIYKSYIFFKVQKDAKGFHIDIMCQL